MPKYVVRPKVDKSKGEEITRYYGVPITSQQITLEYMAREACEQSSLTEPDFIAAINTMSALMRKHLANGDTVFIKDLGLFTISASSNGCDSPEECTPAKVKAKRICFKADKRLRAILEKIKFELK